MMNPSLRLLLFLSSKQGGKLPPSETCFLVTSEGDILSDSANNNFITSQCAAGFSLVTSQGDSLITSDNNILSWSN